MNSELAPRPRFQLNDRAQRLADLVVDRAAALRVECTQFPSGGRLVDCGSSATGGIQAGLLLAQICMADLATVSLVPAQSNVASAASAADSGAIAGHCGNLPLVCVQTDNPLEACILSQYAGWALQLPGYFAMASGPMRVLAKKEPILQHLGWQEPAHCAVGVLETKHLPSEEVLQYVAETCQTAPGSVTLLSARTKSLAGMVQVVARSIETALHKLHEIGFDLTRVISGFGSAPLPPCAVNDMSAIGRTNDSILYGSHVHLWVRGDDDTLRDFGARTPSSSSPAYGEPFLKIFEASGRDFYKIDKMLFSPAKLSLHNVDSGVSHAFGELNPTLLRRSFSE